jgi:dihydrofolate reductase
MISMIAAIDKHLAIGGENDLLWKVSPDMKHFRDLTTGHPIIMGRKTFDSIGRALPNRLNIIITRQPDYEQDGCTVVDSLDKGLEVALKADDQEVFIIGGGEIYALGIERADRLYLTEVEGDYPTADIYFPSYDEFSVEVSFEEHPEHDPAFIWRTLERPSQ